MGAIAEILNQLGATTMPALTSALGSDTFQVLRASKTNDGAGGTTKTYAATAAVGFDCFAAPLDASGDSELEAIVADRKVPIIFRRITCAPAIDCTPQDRVRLLARGLVPQIDNLEVVRSVIVGAARVIITVEEQRVKS